jgi:hypothetical protein
VCARCGEPIDRATRRNSGYCSDDCREEGRGAILRARTAGDAWQFALHPLLYGRLGGPVDDVRLFPQDRERVEQQRAHAGARVRVKAACDGAGLAFLDLVRPDNVTAQLDAGVRVGAATPEAAAIGRRHTKRTLPW